MTDYTATLTFEAPNANAAIQKLTTALYLGDLDATGLRVKEQNSDGTVFDYPATRTLIEGLSND